MALFTEIDKNNPTICMAPQKIPNNQCNLVFFIDLRERVHAKEKYQSAAPPIHAPTGCLLYVPRPGLKPATMAYRDGAPTN